MPQFYPNLRTVFGQIKKAGRSPPKIKKARAGITPTRGSIFCYGLIHVQEYAAIIITYTARHGFIADVQLLGNLLVGHFLDQP